ncbi:MAG: hypothetical protein H0W78_00640 [Planctomycetes bacterium]|nr:hypothetical protein [Planctomycetota bacterium]
MASPQANAAPYNLERQKKNRHDATLPRLFRGVVASWRRGVVVIESPK